MSKIAQVISFNLNRFWRILLRKLNLSTITNTKSLNDFSVRTGHLNSQHLEAPDRSVLYLSPARLISATVLVLRTVRRRLVIRKAWTLTPKPSRTLLRTTTRPRTWSSSTPRRRDSGQAFWRTWVIQRIWIGLEKVNAKCQDCSQFSYSVQRCWVFKLATFRESEFAICEEKSSVNGLEGQADRRRWEGAERRHYVILTKDNYEAFDEFQEVEEKDFNGIFAEATAWDRKYTVSPIDKRS